MATDYQEETDPTSPGEENFRGGEGVSSAKNSMKVVGSIAIVALLGYVAYETTTNDKNTDEILPSFGGYYQDILDFFSDDEEAITDVPLDGNPSDTATSTSQGIAHHAPAHDAAPGPLLGIATTIPPPETESDAVTGLDGDIHSIEGMLDNLPALTPENPYIGLPNRFIGDVPLLGRTWSPQEESVWHEGISHEFTWQHLKTVKDVISERLTGSDAILWEALEDDKFWTRMWAVIGLADFGIEINNNTVLKALRDERPSLITNFFKRFRNKSTPGQRYIMRYAVRNVNPNTRRVIFEALLNANDDLSAIYLVAATLDQDTKVKNWANRNIGRLLLSPEQIDIYKEKITSSSF